ncbi:MAG TPA: hypothetical protein VMJ10_33370 [Kofleriaceae bacterium]|nr:hypothetical protein [Kofleriaceae bacterium]
MDDRNSSARRVCRERGGEWVRPNTVNLAVAADERRAGIDFALEPGGMPMRGKVTEHGGSPIAGARLVAEVPATELPTSR